MLKHPNKLFSRYLPWFLLFFFLLFSASALIYFRQHVGKEVELTKENSDVKNSEEAAQNFYTDPVIGFGFTHESGISISRFEEGEGVSVVLKNSESNFAQIYITAYDEAGPLTPERIKKDLPDKSIIDAKSMKIGDNEVLVFSSLDTGEKIREYWFVKNGYLFRATTEPKDDSLVQKILSTWKYDI